MLALGLDVGGALLPFVTGGGMAVRAAGKVDTVQELSRLFKQSDHVNNTVQLFSRSKDFPLFDPVELQNLVNVLRKEGVDFEISRKAGRVLKSMGADGAYLPHVDLVPGRIVWPENPTRVAVWEELIHLEQDRRWGWNSWNEIEKYLVEIEANETLKVLGNHFGWTADEMASIQKNLDDYKEKFKRLYGHLAEPISFP